MAFNLKLSHLDQSNHDVNICEYQSHIGSVMYAMLGTCPDISFTITKLSQYLSNPGEEHWTAINCLLHYLNTTRESKLVYNGNSNLDDESGYSDSDWAGDPRDYCSVSGFIFTVS